MCFAVLPLISLNIQIITLPLDHSKSNAGAIAGGVVGGVIGLAIIGGGVWWIVRRQNAKDATTAAAASYSSDARVSQYTITSHTSPPAPYKYVVCFLLAIWVLS